MTSPRPYHGVFLTAPVGAGGAPAGWSTVYNGSTDTSAGHNDLRATYPGHDIYQERVGAMFLRASCKRYSRCAHIPFIEIPVKAFGDSVRFFLTQ